MRLGYDLATMDERKLTREPFAETVDCLVFKLFRCKFEVSTIVISGDTIAFVVTHLKPTGLTDCGDVTLFMIVALIYSFFTCCIVMVFNLAEMSREWRDFGVDPADIYNN